MGEKEEGGCTVPALGENAGPVASHIQVEPWVSLGGRLCGSSKISPPPALTEPCWAGASWPAVWERSLHSPQGLLGVLERKALPQLTFAECWSLLGLC